jgi:hypothetical protein
MGVPLDELANSREAVRKEAIIVIVCFCLWLSIWTLAEVTSTHERQTDEGDADVD